MRTLKIVAAGATGILLSTLVLATPAYAAKATDTGHKHVTVSETSDGRIEVDWEPTAAVEYYRVRTSSTPDMSEDIKTYKISRSSTSAVVAPTRFAVAGTGNYTFVRVYAVKKNGKVGESPYKQVRMTAAAPAATIAETVATFNVRTANTEVPGHSWTSRLGAVAGQIQSSGASVVAVQEAGGTGARLADVVYEDSTGRHRRKAFDWQFLQLQRAVGGTYALATDQEYSTGAGREGTRILFDTAKLDLLEQGNFAPSSPDSYLRFVPWAHFADKATGKQFYFIAVHLDNRSGEYRLRLKQIASVIAKATSMASSGEQVILAGDLNSNIYSIPNNAVDEKLISAGFFDAYSAAENTNEFYTTFNDFGPPKKSASRTDYIMTFGGPTGSYAYKNWIVKSGTIPSDHYMQTATVPIG